MQLHVLQHTMLSPPSLSPRVCSDSCPLSQWCHPTISSSIALFSSCPQSFPSSGSFPMSWLFPPGGQSIGASVSVSVLSMNIQGWFPLGLTGLISLQSEELSRVFSSMTNWCHSLKASILRHSTFFMVQLSQLYMTTGKSCFYYIIMATWQRRQWNPAPVLLPGNSHGWRSLVGCGPWGREESDMTERLHFHFSLSCIGEGNGNPLQCSCLENPRDGGAQWAAVCGVTQSWTQLKQLSSSSSSSMATWNSPCWRFKRRLFLASMDHHLKTPLCSSEGKEVIWVSVTTSGPVLDIRQLT